MNSVNITGRITRDPELKVTTSGVSVCSFTIAVRREYKNKQGEYDSDFIPCVCYSGKAEFLDKYVTKGDLLGIVGALRQYKYTTDSGEKRSGLQVSIERDGKIEIAAKKKTSAEYDSDDDLDECAPLDDIPF